LKSSLFVNFYDFIEDQRFAKLLIKPRISQLIYLGEMSRFFGITAYQSNSFW